MSIVLKFNILFLTAVLIGFGVAAYVSRSVLNENAMNQIIENAGLMMETAISSRQYTVDEITPLIKKEALDKSTAIKELATLQAQTAAAPTPAPSTDTGTPALTPTPAAPTQDTEAFHAQTVPAYAATQIFGYLKKKYPDYTYKEATLNPTNLRDRATDFEADIVNYFRDNPGATERSGQRESLNGRVLYLAKPIQITHASCLECHSTPDAAPKSMIRSYGSDNGFHWKLNEVVGAQIVQVPMAVPLAAANKTFAALIVTCSIVFIVILGLLNFGLIYTVIRPVTKLSQIADELSKGKMDTPDLKVDGTDEIATLANSFRRMHISLSKAIKMLED